jgi:hypothetical protein
MMQSWGAGMVPRLVCMMSKRICRVQNSIKSLALSFTSSKDAHKDDSSHRLSYTWIVPDATRLKVIILHTIIATKSI